MASSTKSAPEQPETPVPPTPQDRPAVAFTPIEVPVVDQTVGFTPIAVTPHDQATQAAITKES